jgi:hypothetical protein
MKKVCGNLHFGLGHGSYGTETLKKQNKIVYSDASNYARTIINAFSIFTFEMFS